MQPAELRSAWEKFTKNNDFKLNPDKRHVGIIIEGVLKNEKAHGLKLCPCRLRDGTRQKDLELICPCNFKTHETWLNPKESMHQMCWCGLFIKMSEI
jgi:ferredoxin-thioredoxin reductase catalytic subunit